MHEHHETSGENARSLFDPETVAYLKKLEVSGAPGFIERITGLFRRETPKLLASLHDAIEAEDGESVHRLAHKLKGSFGSIGALPLMERCPPVENAGHEGRFADASAAVSAIEAEFQRAVAGLDELFGRPDT